ncbi:MAG: protein-glutamate O-methyltransferase [Planctomycetes bacterium]|nr:protein-glutamate O-methyltransferase [Planctomycetota bacterium]
MIENVLEDLVLSDEEFATISKLVYEHCKINLHDGKRELVRARLAKRLRKLGIRTFSEYINFALNDESGQEFTNLIDSLSTNLTSFFRENQHFEYLKDVFYPMIMKRKVAQGDCKIRAWSAGCSSGEEPYTIAITLQEAISGQGSWDVKVLATDISTRMLEKAKRGIYEKKRVDPVSPQQKTRYLLQTKIDGEVHYEVGDALRKTVVFAHLNLMESWPIKPPIDFIFCRNVMIYFDKQTQERLVSRFWEMLGHDGILFTGHSESLTGIKHRFKYIQPTIYRKD